MDPREEKMKRSLEIGTYFFKLGLTAFGGATAHIALMENDLVRKRKWVTEEEFLDFVSVTNLIPGPNSTEMALHLGKVRGGWLGFFVGGLAFILPAFLLVSLLAYFYIELNQLPQVDHLFKGMRPVIIAILLQTLMNLRKGVFKNNYLLATTIAAFLLMLGLGHETQIFILAGLGYAGWVNFSRIKGKGHALWSQLSVYPLTSYVQASPVAPMACNQIPSLTFLFVSFFKIGSMLYGSGHALIGLMRPFFVENSLFLTERQLLDAVAIGQFTPGPILTTATFIGHLLLGWRGALISTVAIFLPGFFFVGISGLFIPKIKKSKMVRSLLDGFNAGSYALIAFLTVQLSPYALNNMSGKGIFLLAAFLLIKVKIPSFWVIVGGSLAGLISYS